MAVPGATRPLRLGAGGPCGTVWRPARFVATDGVQRYVCSLCGVIPGSTQLLPCGHTLCETCKVGSIQDGAVGVCPLDQNRFYDDECSYTLLPARKIDTLWAFCWNESHGCRFSGALTDVLRHYEQDCSYHTVECPRCGHSVPHSGLAPHYSSGCHLTMGPAADYNTPPPDGADVELRDVSSTPLQFRPLLVEPRQDQLPALQRKMNELSAEVSKHGRLLQGVSEMLRWMSLKEDGDSGDRLPWLLEQRHILRRLNVLATESLACGQRANAPENVRTMVPAICCFHNEGPQWEGTPATGSLCRLTGTHGGAGNFQYWFCVTHMKDIRQSLLCGRKVLGETTQWHSERFYFTMAVIIEHYRDRLEVSLRFGHTLKSAVPRASCLVVSIGGKRLNEADARGDAFGWQHTFWDALSRIENDGIMADGSMHVLVAFLA